MVHSLLVSRSGFLGCGAGLMASLAAMAGVGSRVSTLIVWFCLSNFHHRAPLLTLLYEPLLVAMFAYLTIDPGRNSWSRPGLFGGPDRITSNVATQLICCHLWIWIAFSVASMLSSPLWWNGEAGWLLLQTKPRLATSFGRLGVAWPTADASNCCIASCFPLLHAEDRLELALPMDVVSFRRLRAFAARRLAVCCSTASGKSCSTLQPFPR